MNRNFGESRETFIIMLNDKTLTAATAVER